MTASFAQPHVARSGPAPITVAIVTVIAMVAALAFAVAGITFVSLAVAFPNAVPIAEAYHLPVSAADAALAQQLAGLWWAFAALAVASFGAAVIVLVKALAFIAPAPRD